jgi:outer membrane receptor protein involved in Fe transport
VGQTVANRGSVMKKSMVSCVSGCAGVVAGAAAPAMSQGSVASPAALDEITVTARRREESLQEIPLAITAFTSADIQRAGIATFGDVAKLTPSLVFEEGFGANDTRPTIRGLPATRGRPPVGVLIDGIDVSSEAIATAGGGILLNLRLLDVERIEVVKGPQSALYGRVAFGGAINYVTAKPGDKLSGRLNATVAEGETYEVAGAVGGPLGDSGWRARVYAGHSQSDGFFRNSVSGENLGGYEATQGSLSFDYVGSDTFAFRGFLSYGDQQNEQRALHRSGRRRFCVVVLVLVAVVARVVVLVAPEVNLVQYRKHVARIAAEQGFDGALGQPPARHFRADHEHHGANQGGKDDGIGDRKYRRSVDDDPVEWAGLETGEQGAHAVRRQQLRRVGGGAPGGDGQ